MWNKIKKDAIFFAIGSIGYPILELAWRGRTHWSMMLAGGICFVLFSRIAGQFEHRPLWLKAILCAVAITGVELIFGMIFNLGLHMNVWDYSQVPLNFMGQICLYFTLLWGVLGALFLPLADLLNHKIEQKNKNNG